LHSTSFTGYSCDASGLNIFLMRVYNGQELRKSNQPALQELQDRKSLANGEFANSDELRWLLQVRQPFCVSIFLRTHRAGPETRQDPIRLKNSLKKAEACLIEMGVRAAVAREILKPAGDLVQRGAFWREQQDGLALFLYKGMFHYLRAPFSFEDFVAVSERFDISPLVPLFTAGGHYFLLALSLNHVRLFRGTASSLGELQVPEMPHSKAEALKYNVRQSQLQLHSGSGGKGLGRSARAGRKESAVFTGQGAGVDDENDRRHEFLLMVQKAVHRFLSSETAPLALAAVTETAAAYRAVNKYPELLDGEIGGNPDGLTTQQLRTEARALVEPYFDRNRREALAKYDELARSGQVANGLEAALISASQGQVNTIFVTNGIHKWGKFNVDDRKVELHEQPLAGDEDLIDLTVRETFLHRGTVFLLPPKQVTSDSEVAAILRY
jgi:hypothetical protein